MMPNKVLGLNEPFLDGHWRDGKTDRERDGEKVRETHIDTDRHRDRDRDRDRERHTKRKAAPKKTMPQ